MEAAIAASILVAGLAAFNVGVEIGQLAIGLSVFLLFRALRPFGRTDRDLRLATVAVSVVIWHAALNS